VKHGHSLDSGDVNGDGHLDLMIGEQRAVGGEHTGKTPTPG
jgi:hypothetical protein